MRIELGIEAPEFEVSSQLSDRLRLSDFRGRKHAALVFLRYVGCPLCQMDLVDLARGHAKLQEKGIEPIVFVESPDASVRKFVSRTPLPYHLVADPDRRLYGLYGLEEGGLGQVLALPVLVKTVKTTLRGHLHGRFEGTERRLPGGFVVDLGGRVVLAHYGRDVSDSLSLERILAAVPTPS